jgi:hypothetical protein
LQADLDRQRAYFEFANHYVTKKNLKYPDFETFDHQFTPDAQVVQEFGDFLKSKSIKFDADSLRAQNEMVQRGIKAEVARDLWGETERYRVILQADPALQEAMTHFPQAELMARGEALEALPGSEKLPGTKGKHD